MMYRAYTRVSSEDQKTDGQKVTINRWLRANAESEPVAWYDADQGYSRLTVKDRPDWFRLMAEAERGDVIVFAQLDRVVGDLLEYLRIRDDLKKRKIGYIFVREGLSWIPGQEPDPFKEALEEVLAVFGKLETRIRRVRQREGIEAARQKNGGKCPWGGREKGTATKATPEKVKAVKAMNADGKPIAEIARVVGLGRQSIYRILGKWDRQPVAAE